MRQTSINYAVALYELGISEQIIQEAQESFQKVPQLEHILADPTISKKKKHEIIRRIFSERLYGFLEHVSDYGNMRTIHEIFEAYREYTAEQKGILSAVLYCVTLPKENQKAQIEMFLRQRYSCREVELEIIQDTSLLGGFLLKVGSEEYDWSLRGRLKRLREKMIRR